ncbi:MAG: cytochrome family protein, partial [Myxococcaceae bacterium]|nr:cytochrome family protein [Myxococcaceae bacterium]
AAAMLGCVLALAGCGKLRDSTYGLPCPEWEKDVAPITAGRCSACHGEAKAEASYRADSYAAAISPRDDGTPRVVPGDEGGSLLLRAASGALPGHPAVAAGELRTLQRWVECRAAPRRLQYHPRGWTNPADPEQFHGVALRALAYSPDSCARCHGEDLNGGKAEVSCTTCHLKGPFDCSACHGDEASAAPPRSVQGLRSPQTIPVGAHQVHLKDGPLHRAYGCAVCHLEPKAPGDEGHYQNQGKLDPFPAEVILTATKGRTSRFDRGAASCENAACHAPSVDSNATRQNPRWTALGRGDADCGTCHGLPPSSHFDNRCEGCHAQVYRGGQIAAPELHANGKVEVGDGSGECTNCHGDATSSAPPRDVSGLTDPTRVSIGAHRAHLTAKTFRGPISCEECHLVPAKPMDRGHLDSAGPAEVFPMEPGVGTLARNDSARPTFDHSSATCATVYCHGGGARAARDLTPGLNRAPIWTGGATPQVYCGSCHGLPPKDGLHPLALPLTGCVSCHAATVGADGKLRFTTDASGKPVTTHLDGKVELGATP